MNKSILILFALVAVAFTVASATVSASVGYRAGPYYSYQPYPYQSGYYGPSYGPYYRGYSAQAGVVPAYSSYQPYYSSYSPYYSSYYAPGSYYPYASRA